MSHRTTSHLIETLGDEVDRCRREVIASIDDGEVGPNGDVCADYEYHARQLIRSIFAFIEAVVFSMKVKAVEYCPKRNVQLSDAERFLAVDIEHVLSEKGEIVGRPAHIRLADNIRFAFALQERALGVAKQFDPSTGWWSCLKLSIKVRDRLTHPKLPGDIDVAGPEIIAALKAYKGFSNQAIIYADLRDEKKRAETGRGAVNHKTDSQKAKMPPRRRNKRGGNA